jgi:hypothetical protein
MQLHLGSSESDTALERGATHRNDHAQSVRGSAKKVEPIMLQARAKHSSGHVESLYSRRIPGVSQNFQVGNIGSRPDLRSNAGYSGGVLIFVTIGTVDGTHVMRTELESDDESLSYCRRFHGRRCVCQFSLDLSDIWETSYCLQRPSDRM